MVGSEDLVDVKFFNRLGEPAGGIQISFTFNPQYKILQCKQFWRNFENHPPEEVNKIWRIDLNQNRTSEIIVVKIYCNDEEVLDFPISSSDTCSEDEWFEWNNDVEKIQFTNLDTASDFYRQPKLGARFIRLQRTLTHKLTNKHHYYEISSHC